MTVSVREISNRIDYTPSVDVAEGVFVDFGVTLGLATRAIKAHKKGSLLRAGIISAPKHSGDTFTVGNRCYFDTTAQEVTDDSSDTYAGIYLGVDPNNALNVVFDLNGSFAAAPTITDVTVVAPIVTTGGVTPQISLGGAIAPTTADATADVVLGASASTKTNLVLQGKSGQSVPLQEYQDSTGAVLASIGATGALACTDINPTGDIQLVENKGILLDAALSATGKYSSTEIELITIGEDAAFGELFYLKAADSKWWKTDANAAATSVNVPLRIIVQAGSANGSVRAMKKGKIRADSLYGGALTVGAPVYVSETAGNIANAAPAGAGTTWVRKIGYSLSATTFEFNPSDYYVAN